MGLSTPARAFLWGDGLAVAGQDLRLQATSALLTPTASGGSSPIASRQGVRPSYSHVGSSGSLVVQPSSGMSLTVNAGMAFVQGTTAANSGTYTVVLDTTGTVTVATSDPTNPRIDNVIVQVTDNGNNTSTAVVTMQTGTPAPSPVAPALPANSLLLATVAVAANTTTIVSGNITDGRVFTVAIGGIVPMAGASPGSAVTGGAGQYIHDFSTGRLRIASGGFARQPQIAAFGAVNQNITGSVTAATGSYTVLASVSVTVDGATEIEVYASWNSLVPPAGMAVGDFCTFVLNQDGFALSNNAYCEVRTDSTSSNLFGGGTLRDWGTLAAGTHTISLQAQSTGHAFPVQNPRIRVAPSLQQ